MNFDLAFFLQVEIFELRNHMILLIILSLFPSNHLIATRPNNNHNTTSTMALTQLYDTRTPMRMMAMMMGTTNGTTMTITNNEGDWETR